MSHVPSPYVVLDRSRCEACWECVAACPEGVIGKVDVFRHRHAVIRAGDRCLGCRRCVKSCKSGALVALKRDDQHGAPPPGARGGAARLPQPVAHVCPQMREDTGDDNG